MLNKGFQDQQQAVGNILVFLFFILFYLFIIIITKKVF